MIKYFTCDFCKQSLPENNVIFRYEKEYGSLRKIKITICRECKNLEINLHELYRKSK